MNKILLISLISFLTVISFSCEKKTNCVSTFSVQSEICIDSTLINDSISCIEIYDPVCGCDGVTYSNSCYAGLSGVLSYVTGECCD